jgi:hypothetical protein
MQALHQAQRRKALMRPSHQGQHSNPYQSVGEADESGSPVLLEKEPALELRVEASRL